jgi:diguanylate cyclase (GGDEF)-like protein
MPQRKKVALWLAWFLIWPALMVYLYNLLQPLQVIGDNWFDILSFAILICVVAFFPIIAADTPIFFIQGISFAAFLYYGLYVEIVITQLAVIALLIKLRISKSEFYRIPANLLLFLLTSIIAAALFYLVGGTIGPLSTFNINQNIAIICYALGIVLANQILLHFLRMFITGEKERFFTNSLLWDIMTSAITMPVGFVLYLLYSELGVIGIYFVGIPFIMISITIRNYYSSNKINRLLKKTSVIGHKLTGKLNVTEVLDIFVKEITELLHVDYTYIYDITNSTETLTLIRVVDQQNQINRPKIVLKKFDGISGTVYGTGYGLFYTSRKQWSNKIVDNTISEEAESIISVPIRRNEKTVGIITIVSTRKRAFEKYHFMILEILANYLAVAIENARHYEMTKKRSERDPLTKLYNFRYFEGYVQNLFEDMQAKGVYEHHSLILLDLDYFKQVNDSYGHESGNVVLKELAQRLNRFSNDDTIVARYGGEEFVVLLKNQTKNEALFVAERLRRIISEEPFIVQKLIEEEYEEIRIYLTASIGVASFPEDCDEPTELIRHADRAMYVGAKQKGRNKVAGYEKAVK